MAAANIEIGCQGWTCADWITPAAGDFVFYPRGIRSGQMLETYARIFSSIEVDSTFYAIPPVSTVENWYQKSPADFTFSLKMPQEITHELRLSVDSYPICEAFCERIRELKEKLAIVLVQLPLQFAGSKQNAKNLRNFIAQLPKDIRFAVEFRNRDWMIDWTFQELEKNNVALCLCEGSWIPREMMFEAVRRSKLDFSYIRFMGERDLPKFDKIYRNEDANLQIWSDEIGKLNAKDVFVYFSNFYEGLAPASANRLKSILGIGVIEAGSLEEQASLF